MCLCQIGDMNIIADARAVLGVIVVTKNRNKFTLVVRYLQDQRDQMRLRLVCFTDTAGYMCAAGVEVTQRDKPQTMCYARPFEHFFHRQLGLTIAVGRLSTVCFQNRNALWFAISRRRRRENNFVDAMCDHRFQQNLCAAQVIVIILQRIRHGFADQ